MQQVRFSAKQPLVQIAATANTYTTAYTIGAPILFPNVPCDPGGVAILQSLILIDKAKQSLSVDLYFFNQLPTSQGGDNTAFALSVAESTYLVGNVTILTTDYTASSIVSIASKKNIVMALSGQQQVPTAAGGGPCTPGGKNIWVVAVARGAPAYTAGCLWLGLGIQQY